MLGENSIGTQREECAGRRKQTTEEGLKIACTSNCPQNDVKQLKSSLKTGDTPWRRPKWGHAMRIKGRVRRTRGHVQIKLKPGKIKIGGDFYFGDIRKKKHKSIRIFFQNIGG